MSRRQEIGLGIIIEPESNNNKLGRWKKFFEKKNSNYNFKLLIFDSNGEIKDKSKSDFNAINKYDNICTEIILIAHGANGRFYNNGVLPKINTFFNSSNFKLNLKQYGLKFRFQVCTGNQFVKDIKLPGTDFNNPLTWEISAPDHDSFVTKNGRYADLPRDFKLEAFIPLYLLTAWTDKMKDNVSIALRDHNSLKTKLGGSVAAAQALPQKDRQQILDGYEPFNWGRV